MHADDLTADLIASAKANDLAAITKIIEFTEPRVNSWAYKIAPSASELDMREDLAQIGRIAVWESIAAFEGSNPGMFLAFVERNALGKMSAERQRQTRPGVSRPIAADFEKALSLAAGDPYEAERIAQDKTHMGVRRMSAEMAYAARMAWSGAISLETPTGSADGSHATLGDMVADTMGIPAELVTSDDITRHKREMTRRAVHRTLGRMSERRRDIIHADFSFDDARFFGGDDVPDAELAAQIGITADNLKVTRGKALAQFRELYLAGAGNAPVEVAA